MVVLLTIQIEVYACSCADVVSLQEGMRSAEDVFQGEVDRIEHEELLLDGQDGPLGPALPRAKVSFNVKRVWKGQREPAKYVSTPAQIPACGVDFKVQREYLVFAWPDSKGDLYTHSCSATRPMELAAEDLETIGPGAEVFESRG